MPSDAVEEVKAFIGVVREARVAADAIGLKIEGAVMEIEGRAVSVQQRSVASEGRAEDWRMIATESWQQAHWKGKQEFAQVILSDKDGRKDIMVFLRYA